MSGFQGTDKKSLERRLVKLENKYDKPTKHIRDYYEDVNDINLLLRKKVIDIDHADLFKERAKAKVDEEEERRKETEAIVVGFYNYVLIKISVSVIGAVIGFLAWLYFIIWPWYLSD